MRYVADALGQCTISAAILSDYSALPLSPSLTRVGLPLVQSAASELTHTTENTIIQNIGYGTLV